MEFDRNEWLGCWVNFESYIYSEESAMVRCWEEAESAARMMPMFRNGAKAFWQMACDTVTDENPICLGGWHIESDGEGMQIEWIGENGEHLGKYTYVLSAIVPKGLEAAVSQKAKTNPIAAGPGRQHPSRPGIPQSNIAKRIGP